MKKLICAAMLLCMVGAGFGAGRKVALYAKKGHVAWGIVPSLAAAGSDTIGPIEVGQTEYASFSAALNKLDHKDTALVDSGMVIKTRVSFDRTKADMRQLTVADSILRPYDASDDTTRIRTFGKIISLTLPKAPYLWVIIDRWDTNTDTLDFKNATGVADSTCLVLDLF